MEEVKARALALYNAVLAELELVETSETVEDLAASDTDYSLSVLLLEYYNALEEAIKPRG